jgi:hypothetical protein
MDSSGPGKTMTPVSLFDTRPILAAGAALLLTTVAGGCKPSSGSAAAAQPAPGNRTGSPSFTDVTKAAGIRFIHSAGASGNKYFPETMSGGVVSFDYDGDGRQDLLFLNGAPLPGYQGKRPLYPALYRNLGGLRFEDTTSKTGLAVEMYAMGATVGDYDADGDDDLYVTCVLGPSYLFRNDAGHFINVAAAAGVERPGTFPSSATWLDYDRDGDLDLFVCNYIRYRSINDDLPCFFKETIRSYCIPFAYKAEEDRLYQNQGNGRFKDVTRQAGVGGPDGKSLGVAVWDLNDDDWPDLLIANDTTPTYAFINQKDGTFKEQAAEMGLAYGSHGFAKAGMGIDAADDQNSGKTTVVMTNFSGEMLGLYRDGGGGLFEERSQEAGVGQSSAQLLGFGTFFFDFDNDGWQDLLVANGHVQDKVEQFSEGVAYRQPPLLFRNDGTGNYQDVTAQGGAPLREHMVARGAVWTDLDDDGRLDVVISENQGPAHVWRNDSASGAHWLKVRLVGTRSNRNGYGAKVTVQSAAGPQLRLARGGSSYCSQPDQRSHFGLGSEAAVKRIEVRWPSGTVDVLTDVKADQLVTVKEGSHG